MCGVTTKCIILNEHISGTTRVVQVPKNSAEKHLKWYGHVMRREEEDILRRVLGAGIKTRESEDEGCQAYRGRSVIYHFIFFLLLYHAHFFIINQYICTHFSI